jgi:uncharacterized protein involved in cysteine biosynthesis
MGNWLKSGLKEVYTPANFNKDPPLRPLKTAVYPFKGIAYFFTHPSLWAIVVCPVIVTVLVAIAATIIVFAGLMYPQYLLISDYIIHINWVAWLVTVILCILEVLFIVALTVVVFFDGTKRRIYKQVFRLHDVHVRKAAQTYGVPIETHWNYNRDDQCCWCWICTDSRETLTDCCCFCLNPVVYWKYFFYKVLSAVVFLVSLPLNLIPILGTLFFCMINGTFMAWRLQFGYFTDKEIPPAISSYIFTRRLPEYMSFGTVCMLLDFIPVLNLILIYTNVVASGEFSLFSLNLIVC